MRSVSAAREPARAPVPPVTDERERWVAMVAAVLDRAGRPSDDPELALTRTTLDDLAIAPLYTAADLPHAATATGLPGQAPFVRGATTQRGWDVRQRHFVDDPVRVNAAARDDLANGVTSLWLTLDSAEDVAPVLAEVDLARTPVVLEAGEATLDAAAVLIGLDRGWHGAIGVDPIGWAYRTQTPVDLEVATRAWRLSHQHQQLQAIVVDGTVFHDAGASDADELAITTAAGLAYLRTLTDAGASVDDALLALEFRLAVTDDQFASITKLRAARRIWNRVGEHCGASASTCGQRQHASTSAAMLTRRDPMLNVVRSSIAAFAAAAAGAQAISVTPYDQALGRSNDAARRIARNVQSVLHDEASLARVADPGGGSWYVEARTEALARAGLGSLRRAGTPGRRYQRERGREHGRPEPSTTRHPHRSG